MVAALHSLPTFDKRGVALKIFSYRSLFSSPPSAGFTLIELLVSVAILSVMLSIAAPNYRSVIADQKVRSTASQLHSSTLVARSEAIKRNRVVRVRPVTGGAWEDGWLIPLPSNLNSDANPILEERLKPGVTITGGPELLDFRPSGRLKNASEVRFEITATSDSTKQRCLSVELDGRVTTRAGGCQE